jgi:hypothetical protein
VVPAVGETPEAAHLKALDAVQVPFGLAKRKEARLQPVRVVGGVREPDGERIPGFRRCTESRDRRVVVGDRTLCGFIPGRVAEEEVEDPEAAERVLLASPEREGGGQDGHCDDEPAYACHMPTLKRLARSHKPFARLVEKVGEEALALVLLAVAAAVLVAVAEQSAEAAHVAQAATAVLVTVLLAVLAAPLVVSAAATALVVLALRVDQPLELAAVEEDAAAAGALVYLEAAALVGAHRALALGTFEFGHTLNLAIDPIEPA